MLSKKEKLEYDMLTILRDEQGPVGCGSIVVKLQTVGHTLSEATVGRVLRELDVDGFTNKAGFRGRKLSDMGINRMTELNNKELRLKWRDELTAAVQGHTRDQLLEVLVARRVIESELAYLAAKNASPEEVKRLHAVIARQKMDHAGKGSDDDVEFHTIIADMARNRVLAAAITLIRQDVQLTPVLEYIRMHVHSLLYVEHQKIVDNITASNAEGAKAAMIEPMNKLIHDVEKYWDNIEE